MSHMIVGKESSMKGVVMRFRPWFMPHHGKKGIEELIIALLRGCDPNGVHLTLSKLVPGSTDDNFLACYNKRGKVSAAGGMP